MTGEEKLGVKIISFLILGVAEGNEWLSFKAV